MLERLLKSHGLTKLQREIILVVAEYDRVIALKIAEDLYLRNLED
jgi:hypothetical protein